MSKRRRIPDDPRNDMAVDGDGQALAYSPEAVRAIVLKMVEQGEILAVLVRVEGQLAVQVFGPPSHELLDALETTCRAYRRVLQGH